MSVLLPLYMYPWPGTWDPLYWAANVNPQVQFTVILNPCSGPCVNSTPEAPYLIEMPRLREWPNIRTLGYVATNYTNKPIDDLINEIHTYANWSSILNDTRMAVDGIFFDETPGAYDWQKHAYLTQAHDEVKRSEMLGQRIVVHNPGVLPDITWNYLDITDITVIWEETFTNWLDRTKFNRLKNFHNTTNLPKSAFAIMLHSIPDIPDELLEWTVAQLKEMVEWNFISSVSQAGEYWHSFSSVFGKFMEAYGKT
ncbi:Spherulation-specific family 4 [Massariosphaeria phaeospora]|uniref:Spherulation-specific family 4 n=1 Tax=Massariosphaeria phaeospora TaxID=100035 RepID=A0A7C8IHJ9_9PLEO|nr:Spherulation-specific family 4 [Massariosphaeria phaeospora]